MMTMEQSFTSSESYPAGGHRKVKFGLTQRQLVARLRHLYFEPSGGGGIQHIFIRLRVVRLAGHIHRVHRESLEHVVHAADMV